MVRARLGQHFLTNPRIAERIIRTLRPRRGEAIIEIGPGRGALTAPLVALAKESGARVIAVERDRALAEALEPLVRASAGTLHVVSADILAFLPEFMKEVRSGCYSVIGNIPYYLTGHLLRALGELSHKPHRVALMLQKEVAERAAALPPKMNKLSASVRFWARPEIAFSVSPSNFRPAPKVESALLFLAAAPSPPISANQYSKTVRALFSQPRKTILNNLARAYAPRATNDSGARERTAELLAKLSLAPTLRPQNLSVRDIARIAAALHSRS